MRNIGKILALLCCVTIIISCTSYSDEIDSTPVSTDNSFALTFSLDPDSDFSVSSSLDSKATTETVLENELRDIWILMFDEDGERIEPSSAEKYYTDSNGTAQLRQGAFYESDDYGESVYTDEIYGSTYISNYQSGSDIYVNKALSASIRHIRVIANTNNANHPKFIASSCQRMSNGQENDTPANDGDTLHYRYKHFTLDDNIYRESDMWNTYDGDINYLRMVGNWDGEIPATGLDFNIGILTKPMAAKLTVSYTCIDDDDSDSEVTVSSVQVTRVSQKCYYKDVEDPTAHENQVYTNYQPRYVVTENYISEKDGAVSFYVPQNLRGIIEENETPSDKSENHPKDATCVIITATHKYYDPNTWTFVEQPIYIELYPGENNYNDYNIKLRREYFIDCTITADEDGAKWDVDSRVTTEEVLPEGPIVHYEFNPNDLTYNSAYDASGNLLGGYPSRGSDYISYSDQLRTSYTYAYAKTSYVATTTTKVVATTYTTTLDPDTGKDVVTSSSATISTSSTVTDAEDVYTTFAYQTTTTTLSSETTWNDDETIKYVETVTLSEVWSPTGEVYDANYNQIDYDDLSIYDLNISGLDDYYDRYIYGFSGTSNVIASDSRPFLRNLAIPNPDYNNYDGHAKTHPEVFDCTFIKDNRSRYSTATSVDYYTTYSSGELSYTEGSNYINSSLIQLLTGWGTGETPYDPNTEFTIVFIGSAGVNLAMGRNIERAVYYGNSIEWNKRWYFYRASDEAGTSTSFIKDGVTYGFAADQTIAIDALVADSYQNVQSYDICRSGQRKVYYNNVDVEALSAPSVIDPVYTDGGSSSLSQNRPSTSEYVMDSPISIFGHTTDDNMDDAIDAKLRLFLIYDRALTLEDIDQIRRYAALKELLLYGVDDSDTADSEEIDVHVTLEPASDSSSSDTTIGWESGNSGSTSGDVTFE